MPLTTKFYPLKGWKSSPLTSLEDEQFLIFHVFIQFAQTKQFLASQEN